MSKPPLLNSLPCVWRVVYLQAGFVEATGITNKQKKLMKVPMNQSCWGLCCFSYILSLSLQTEIFQFNPRGIAILFYVLLMALRPDCNYHLVAEQHMLLWLVSKFLCSLMHCSRLGKLTVKPRISRRAVKDVPCKCWEFCRFRAAQSRHFSLK